MMTAVLRWPARGNCRRSRLRRACRRLLLLLAVTLTLLAGGYGVRPIELEPGFRIAPATPVLSWLPPDLWYWQA